MPRHLDTRQGLITPGWVAQVRVSGDLKHETLYDPGFFTNDVSNCTIWCFKKLTWHTQMKIVTVLKKVKNKIKYYKVKDKLIIIY